MSAATNRMDANESGPSIFLVYYSLCKISIRFIYSTVSFTGKPSVACDSEWPMERQHGYHLVFS